MYRLKVQLSVTFSRMKTDIASGHFAPETPENSDPLLLAAPLKTTEYAGTVAATVGALLLSGCVVIAERPSYDHYPSRHYEPVRERHYKERRRIIVVERPVIVERKIIVVAPKHKKDNDRHHRDHDRKN